MNAPLFPLPNVVFFPDTYLPLHVFEPRYRAMMEAVVEGNGLIAMVLAREERPPGEAPAIHDLGTLGRVEAGERLDDGRWRIALHGLTRVAFGEPRAQPGGWFSAPVEALVDRVPDLQDPRVAEAKARLLLTARRYGEQVLRADHADDYLTTALPFPAAVHRAATILRAGMREKQALLAMGDLEERGRAVETAMDEQIQAQAAIEKFAARRPIRPGES